MSVPHYLMLGRTRVGKSSFVNAAFGRRVASTCDYEPCTNDVQYHQHSTRFGEICLIDTPGLAEDTIECDRRYLDLVTESVDLNQLTAVPGRTHPRPPDYSWPP
jgi:predicted GTPase